MRQQFQEEIGHFERSVARQIADCPSQWTLCGDRSGRKDLWWYASSKGASILGPTMEKMQRLGLINPPVYDADVRYSEITLTPEGKRIAEQHAREVA